MKFAAVLKRRQELRDAGLLPPKPGELDSLAVYRSNAYLRSLIKGHRDPDLFAAYKRAEAIYNDAVRAEVAAQKRESEAGREQVAPKGKARSRKRSP